MHRGPMNVIFPLPGGSEAMSTSTPLSGAFRLRLPALLRLALVVLASVGLSSGCSRNPALDGSPRSNAAARAAGGGAELDREATAYWRDVDPENLLILSLEWGDVLVELAPQFAPSHVEQVRRLARTGYYDTGASFYRVIDNFVAQGGVMRDGESEDGEPHPLQAEFERPLRDLVFVRNDSPDLYAPETGHIDGFAVGHDPATGMVWPLHCYGAMAMARSTGPDTGSSHFYMVIGRDQRYLDRNLTVFGRVIAGMDHLQRVARGDRAIGNGVIPDAADRSPILGMTMAADLADEERPKLQVMKSDSPAFAAEKELKYYRDSEFFQVKPLAVEACAVPGPVRPRPGAEEEEEEE